VNAPISRLGVDCGCDSLADILRVLLSADGYVTIQCQVFFDESATHDGTPILCIAGYIFRKNKAIKLGHEWRKVLRWKRLPYFRMVECAHGNGPFANLTKAERVEVATRMIEIIKSYAVQGIAVTVDKLQFVSAMAEFPNFARVYKTAYICCTHIVLAGVSCWIEVNPLVGEMAYFFEAGHASASQSNKIMNELFHSPEMKAQYRYVAHGFVEKKNSFAVQAADLLAWQWYKDKKNQLEGRPRRKDCASLLQLHHDAAHLDRAGIIKIIESSNQMRGFSPALARRILLAQFS
jgi:hypothetical protein